MQNILLVHGPKISWRLNHNTPKTTKLSSVGNYQLLNPYWYAETYKKHSCLANQDFISIDDQCIIHTVGLILRSGQNSSNKVDLESFFESLTHFLRYLRYSSLQFGLRAYGSTQSLTWIDKATVAVNENTIKVPYMKIRSRYYHSMTNWINIKTADKLCFSEFEIPVFEEILMDAMEGSASHDYRKAILYSAISVESMLANVFEQRYLKIQEKTNTSQRFRVVTQDGKTKDPVFQALWNRTDFKRLLHEVPLYIDSKSLLLENENLYSKAIKLYTTRNKIVHWGAPLIDDNRKTLEISEKGVRTAIETALELFEWMGFQKFNCFKESGFIEIGTRKS